MHKGKDRWSAGREGPYSAVSVLTSERGPPVRMEVEPDTNVRLTRYFTEIDALMATPDAPWCVDVNVAAQSGDRTVRIDRVIFDMFSYTQSER